jgi:acyl transferase domain-containing protein
MITRPPWLLCVSASDQSGLVEQAREAAEALAAGTDPRQLSLHDVTQSTSYGPERLAVVSADRAGLVESFSFFAEGVPSPRWTHARVTDESGPLTWCFGGHGGQWLAMGRDLLANVPPAARVLKALDGLLPGGVVDSLTNSTTEGFDSPATSEPLIFAIQVAMASWLLGVGIEPSAVVGHSLGEVAAAHIAGTLTLPEAATVVAVRSSLLDRTAGQGAMATVTLDHRAVARIELPSTGCGPISISIRVPRAASSDTASVNRTGWRRFRTQYSASALGD